MISLGATVHQRVQFIPLVLKAACNVGRVRAVDGEWARVFWDDGARCWHKIETLEEHAS